MTVVTPEPEPLSCKTCGAAVTDPALHAAWHRLASPLVAASVDASELADEVMFALRRIRRGGVL